MSSKLASLLPFIAAAYAQQIGTLTAEVHPPLTWQQCTAPGSCTTIQGSVTMDANWRWTHSTSGSTNCYTGNTWDKTLCPDDTTCATNCALDGASYSSTYGVTTSGSALRLNFVTNSAQKNVGSRLFLMADDTHYKTFDLRNQEFTFDVDVSKLPCGLNGALYMSSMAADGGVSKYPTNKAGAKYGVGYCDSQCPRDLKFINGQANVEGWVPSSNNVNTGYGNHGSCCAEMDIWEANSISAALTPHSCDTVSQTMCTGDACGGAASSNRYGGTCDPDGCDFNSYRMGDTSFYGPGKKVDTNSVFTVVTQYLTNDGTATGTISEIKRFYVQNGVVIPNSMSTIAGVTGNSINDNFCKTQKTVFNNQDTFNQHGGLASMSQAMKEGMVLVLSLWDDYAVNMLWLDSSYPDARGTCSTSSGVPADVEANSPNAYVIYSNIKVGAINSTFSGTTSGGGSGSGTTTKLTSTLATSTTKAATSTSSSASTTGAAHWGQCGGASWNGPKTCAGGYTCTYVNDFYSQCL
ncbi:glycoside hydrolase [Tricladium varicosporioides]|nr:glycoside hydrolase [Hymenoscyphus varicosporioides]